MEWYLTLPAVYLTLTETKIWKWSLSCRSVISSDHKYTRTQSINQQKRKTFPFKSNSSACRLNQEVQHNNALQLIMEEEKKNTTRYRVK